MTPHHTARPLRALLTALVSVGTLAGCGPGTATVTPPAAPTGLAVSGTTPTSVTLAWTATANATGYTLERRTDTTPYVQIATPPAGTTTYTDTGLGASTTYTYHLNATTPAGTSAFSAEVSATTAPADPAAPTVDTVNVVNGVLGTPEQVTVSGAASAHSGTLQRVSVTWGDGSAATDVTATSASFAATHTYGASGTYTVTVTATDSAGRAASTTRTLDVTRFQTGSQLHVVFDGNATPRELSGNARTGVYTGSGCFTAVEDRYGVAGQAERFNDPTVAACTVNAAGGANTKPFTLPGSFTAGVWIRPDASRVTQGGWLAGQQGGAFSMTLGTDGRVTARLAASGGTLDVKDPGAVPGDVWTLYIARVEVAGTPAQSTLRLYRRDSPTDQTTPARLVGEAQATGSYALPANLPWTVAEANGGAASGTGDRPFSGDVDDLRVYSRALAEYEISALSRLDRYPKP